MILRGEANDIVGIQNIIKTYKNPKKKEDAHTSYRYSANIVIAGNRYNQSRQYLVAGVCLHSMYFIALTQSDHLSCNSCLHVIYLLWTNSFH